MLVIRKGDEPRVMDSENRQKQYDNLTAYSEDMEMLLL